MVKMLKNSMAVRDLAWFMADEIIGKDILKRKKKAFKAAGVISVGTQKWSAADLL